MSQPDAQKNRALDIVRIAKTDRARAEQLALGLIDELAPELGTQSLTINENSVLSLNSVNGRITAPGKQYFFKFHAEKGDMDTLKNSEYYNAELLVENGWPMIPPVFTSREPGMQFVVYDYIKAPTAYVAYGELEDHYLAGNGYQGERMAGLFGAEVGLCQKIREGYLKSLELTERAGIENASLNQLFYVRLAVGTPEKQPRLQENYIGKEVRMPSGETVPFNDIAKMPWTINGIKYEETLESIIAKSKDLLNPAKEERTPSVVGHGDDHNGNRFLIGNEFKFFDPAFAGRQPALLSFVKATAHNTLLHPKWLYEPKELEGKLKLNVSIKDGAVSVDHNWKTEELSPLRLSILDIYAKEVWRPLLQEMSARGMLPDYWREYIRAALFCCPFLVLNLIGDKYSPAQSILALSKCVELGSQGDAETTVGRFLKSIEPKTPNKV